MKAEALEPPGTDAPPEIDTQRDRGQLDIVDGFADPLPVTVMCHLLGVPRDDEPHFHNWAAPLARSLDPSPAFEQG